MRLLCGLVVLTGLAAACDVDMEELKSKDVNGNQDLSIFQIYASKYCDLRNADDTRTLRLDCAALAKFLEPGAMQCSERDGFVPHTATFPDRVKSMRVCRDLDNEARQDQDRVTFLLFGDVGAGEDPEQGKQQLRVAKAMTGVCPPRALVPDGGDGSPRCDFALVVGDLIYPRGVESVWDPLLTSRFEDAYGHFGTFDFFMVPGNHDYLGSVTAQVEYTYFSDRWRMPARHYAVPDLPSWLHIYGLDTTAMVDHADFPGAADTTEEQFAAARENFCGKEGWRLAFGHHPPFSNGKHGGGEPAAIKIGRLAEECPFHLYMTGHDHHQEHLTTEAFDILIQGAGGAEVNDVRIVPDEQNGRLGDDLEVKYRQLFGAGRHGFAVVDATVDEIDVRFYDVSKWNYAGGVYTDPIDYREHIYRCRITKASGSHTCVPVEDAAN